jgi:hypothetical protein
MATGTTTSNQWKAAALAAEDAAYKADLAAFAAEQGVLDAKANVFKAQLAIETATTQQNPTALAAAKQQLVVAQNSVVTATSNASQVRQQSNNANAAAEAAAAKAAENASNPVAETTPPPASASPVNPTSYQYIPATVTPVTSPSPSAANGFSASSVTTSTYSRSQTTTVENTTGGGSVTTVSTPAIATPRSTALQSQADVAQKQADLLSLNPNTAFGQRALDRKLAEGTITQEQYNYVKGLSNEDRIAAKNAELNKAIDLQTQANSSTFQPPPTVTVTPNQNTTEVTVTNVQTASLSQSTTINGEITGYNVSTEVIDGETYQVTTNADGSTAYTASDGFSITGDEDYTPLQEPPGVTADEFDGIDQQVADNENALQEPPQLSDDEVDAYLQQGGEPETITSPDSITENVFDPRQEVEENVFNPTQDVQESVFDPSAGGSGGYSGTTAKLNTQSQATQQDVANFKQKEDWRVRLSLAPGATYLYKDSSPGILAPLAATDGVIFPYTPSISVAYSAAYDPTELTHTNYKFFQYKSSSVDSVNLTCDFTAQDTFEANYLLAVIHFFRSVTKMFYGQDQNPKPGTPPPLCYLSGLGSFQFDAHPLAVTGFTYSLPNDVDYIRAGSTTTNAGVSKAQSIPKINVSSASASRMDSSNLNAGGTQAPPKFASNAGTTEPTYVPTKMQISITAIPIVTRNDISNKFSLKEYATGKLLRGTQRSGGGIW